LLLLLLREQPFTGRFVCFIFVTIQLLISAQ